MLRSPVSLTRSRERSLIEIAVAACLLAARAASADQSTAAPDTSSGELAEVTVTAQRRTENLQDVPNVTLAGAGPGQSHIYMRGLSIGPGTIQGGGAVGDCPNVAVYLDDQSAHLPGRNLDL